MKNAYYIKSTSALYTSENITPCFLNIFLSGPLGLNNQKDFILVINSINPQYEESKNNIQNEVKTGIAELDEALNNKNGEDNCVIIIYQVQT